MVKTIIIIILGLVIGAASTYAFFYSKRGYDDQAYAKQVLELQLEENQTAISQAAILTKENKQDEAKIVLQNHLEKIKLKQKEISVDERLSEKNKSHIISVLAKESDVINELVGQIEN